MLGISPCFGDAVLQYTYVTKIIKPSNAVLVASYIYGMYSKVVWSRDLKKNVPCVLIGTKCLGTTKPEVVHAYPWFNQ